MSEGGGRGRLTRLGLAAPDRRLERRAEKLDLKPRVKPHAPT